MSSYACPGCGEDAPLSQACPRCEGSNIFHGSLLKACEAILLRLQATREQLCAVSEPLGQRFYRSLFLRVRQGRDDLRAQRDALAIELAQARGAYVDADAIIAKVRGEATAQRERAEAAERELARVTAVALGVKPL